MRWSALWMASLVLITGCTNSFLENYQGERFASVPSPQLVAAQPADAVQIGVSSFVSARHEGNSQALAAAKAVGADFVQWTKEYQGTTQSSGMLPMTTPTSSTTHYNTYSSGSLYGNTGYAGSYSGTSYGTATTYGSETTYVPYTRVDHWWKYSAFFYRSSAHEEAIE